MYNEVEKISFQGKIISIQPRTMARFLAKTIPWENQGQFLIKTGVLYMMMDALMNCVLLKGIMMSKVLFI